MNQLEQISNAYNNLLKGLINLYVSILLKFNPKNWL